MKPLFALLLSVLAVHAQPLMITGIQIQPIDTNQLPITSFPWTIPILVNITLNTNNVQSNVELLLPTRVAKVIATNDLPPMPPTSATFKKQCPLCHQTVLSTQSTSTFNGGKVVFLATFECPQCKLRFGDSLEAVVRDTPKMEPVK